MERSTAGDNITGAVRSVAHVRWDNENHPCAPANPDKTRVPSLDQVTIADRHLENAAVARGGELRPGLPGLRGCVDRPGVVHSKPIAHLDLIYLVALRWTLVDIDLKLPLRHRDGCSEADEEDTPHPQLEREIMAAAGSIGLFLTPDVAAYDRWAGEGTVFFFLAAKGTAVLFLVAESITSDRWADECAAGFFTAAEGAAHDGSAAAGAAVIFIAVEGAAVRFLAAEGAVRDGWAAKGTVGDNWKVGGAEVGI
eukprot:CAMPEP_0194291030 /NCGR_PEP_ID=MMETSP0169-20130528/42598_1 /TAXON_ID=218684 /ORGANISM="Corethron pennatum, Strain L29A3" /LENGTH=252 /DNA_ID=CAMNT_0039038795 /DNA_START=469 /DNA_END=1228 /DNA_ORIENTATION=+